MREIQIKIKNEIQNKNEIKIKMKVVEKKIFF
jgi:hypothetical protein